MKKIIISAVIVVLSLAGIIYVIEGNKAGNDAIAAAVAKTNPFVAVKTAEAVQTDIFMENPVNGIFAPFREVQISTELPGRVTSLAAKEGDAVKAGQVLATIKSDIQDIGLSNAEAVYQNAAAEYERFQSAYTSGGVTQQQLQQMKLQLENAKNNLESAKISVADVNIKASFAGIVNKRNIEAGSYVAPGQVLFEIVDVSSLKLKVNVDEKNVTTIKQGQEITVGASVIPDKKWTGKVSFIAPRAENNLTFPVELNIENPDGALKAGMYGTAYPGVSGDNNSAVVIPLDAFVGSVSSNQIYLAKNGKAVLTQVTTGKISGNNIEILSGAEAGDKVIIAGQINLTDGAAIQIVE